MDKDQMVVKEFLQGLGSSFEARDPVEYLKNIQRMKGEWFNQQGRMNEKVVSLRFSRLLTYSDTMPKGVRFGSVITNITIAAVLIGR